MREEVSIGTVCVVDIAYDLRLILQRVDTPSTAYDAYIAFLDNVAGRLERSKAIVYLSDAIKVVVLCAHNGRLVGDVAFWETLKGWTVDTLARATPKLGKQ